MKIDEGLLSDAERFASVMKRPNGTFFALSALIALFKGSDKEIHMGQFVAYLVEEGFYKRGEMCYLLTDEARQSGLFRERPTVMNDRGREVTVPFAYLTGKGLMYFANLIDEGKIA